MSGKICFRIGFVICVGAAVFPPEAVAAPPDLNQQHDYLFPPPEILRKHAFVEFNTSQIDTPVTVQYVAFDKTNYVLTQYTGKYTALLLQASWDSALTMQEKRTFVDRADLLYQHYRDILGADPPGGPILTIAVVKTCGYGCGYIGAKNIELADDSTAMTNFKMDMDAGHTVSPLTHEMAHNFDIYNAYQSYWADQSHAWTSFWERYIKVYMQEGDVGSSPKQVMQGAIDSLYLTYLNSTNTWATCVKGSVCTAPVTQNSAWSGIMYQVAKLHGPEAIRNAMSFMKSYAAGHVPPATPEAREDLHIQALANGAGQNLSCYVDAWRWYASSTLRDSMAAQFGATNPFCQDLDRDGYSPFQGDADDSNPGVHPGATEVLNGIDDDCDGVIDNLKYVESADFPNFPNTLPVNFPARIVGQITAGDSDAFSFNLPSPGNVQFTLRSTPDFQGWMFVYQQGSDAWFNYEYVSAGSSTTTSWYFPAAGVWRFSVELNSVSAPGQYTVEISAAPRWPQPWAATAVPAFHSPYHLSGATQTLADVAETPTTIRYWVTGIGLVGSTSYSSNAAFDWTPPAGMAPGTYAYRVQLLNGLHPIADMSPPVEFNIAATGNAALSISKTHSGNFARAQKNAAYTITVSNAMGAAATNGTVMATDTLPAGMTIAAMSGLGWNCAANSCSRNDALNGGSSYPPITVTVNVALDALSSVINLASVSGGGSAASNASDTTAIGPFRVDRDFRGVGRADVFLYDFLGGYGYAALSNGNGSFSYVYSLITSGFDKVRTGDFDGDGKTDLLLYNSISALGYLESGNGDGTFRFGPLFWSPGYRSVEIGDLNGDGKADVLLYRDSDGTLYTGLSNGAGGFTYTYNLVTPGFTQVRLADFDGDGKSDVLLYKIDGTCYVGLSNGNGTFSFSPVALAAGYTDMQVGDFNGDGKMDFLLYNASNGVTAVGLSAGNGFAILTYGYSPGFTATRVADYTGDGKADVIFYNANTALAYLGAGDGAGGFNFQSLFWSPGFDWVEPQDVNGDGKMDVILYNSRTGTEYTGIRNGSGGFSYLYSYWGSGKTLAR